MQGADTARALIGRRLLALPLVALMVGVGPSPAAPLTAPAKELEAVYGACVQAMLRSTCRVANDKSTAAPTAKTVFVAGVGQVDAASYQKLRAAGEAMCTDVRKACSANWSSAACRTGRSLWGG